MPTLWALLLAPEVVVGEEPSADAVPPAVEDGEEPTTEPAGTEADGGPAAPSEEIPVVETVVRASRPCLTASSRRVEGEALATAPRRGTPDLLRLLPGVLVVQHGAEGKGHQIFLRGFDAAHGTDVEVLVAGMPINSLSNVHGHGYLDLNFVPPEAVERLEVQRGAFDLRQGDLATAGTIRLRLGVPQDARGARLGYEGGLTNRHRVWGLWAPAGAAGHFVASELVRDDGFGDDRWSRRVSLLGGWDGEAAGSGPRVVVGLYTASYGSPNAVRAEDVQSGAVGLHDSYVHGLEGRTSRAFAVASKRVDLGAHRVELVAGTTLSRFGLESNYTGYLHEGALGDTRRQRHDALESFLSGWWEHRRRLARRPLQLRAGLEWRGDWLSQGESMIELARRSPWRVDRDATAQLNRITIAAGAFWAPLWWLHAEVGARGDLFVVRFEDLLGGGRQYDDFLYAVSPRATLRFPVARCWTLFAAYGRGLRSPEARSVAYASLPDEDVDLELYRGGEPVVTASDEVEAGIRYGRGDAVELSLAAFATFVGNERIYDHVSATNVELSSTRRLGGDLGLRARPRPWLHLRADLTVVEARFEESGNPVPGVPWFLTSFGVVVAHRSGLRGSVSGFYMAPRPLAHGATGTHQIVLDVAAAYRWRFLELRLELNNVLDWDWREGEYHFASWFDRSRPRSAIPVTHVTAGTPFDLRASVTFWL